MMTTNNSATIRRLFEDMRSGDEAVLSATIEECHSPDYSYTGWESNSQAVTV